MLNRIFFLLCLLPLGFAFAKPLPTVVDVYDGDTVTLSTGDKVRLRWVNAPELQPQEAYGLEAREAAREAQGAAREAQDTARQARQRQKEESVELELARWEAMRTAEAAEAAAQTL